jgi:hypothetical protein
MSRHKEQLRREFDPHNFHQKLKAGELLEWIERVNFPVHHRFSQMLGVMVQAGDRGTPNANEEYGEASSGIVDNRERISLAKLITALAIDGYGYKPTSRRSPIPNEITSITDRLGLSVSNDTVRKYLRLGAQHLPEGWNDE